VARVDRRSEVVAADDDTNPASLRSLRPRMQDSSPRPHDRALGVVHEHLIYAVESESRLRRSRCGIDWRGEGVLLTRPHGAEDQPLSRAGAAFRRPGWASTRACRAAAPTPTRPRISPR
jgi:hypothetical protein